MSPQYDNAHQQQRDFGYRHDTLQNLDTSQTAFAGKITPSLLTNHYSCSLKLG